MAIRIDTLKNAKNLRAAGFPEDQAEAIATTIAEGAPDTLEAWKRLRAVGFPEDQAEAIVRVIADSARAASQRA